MTVQRLGLDYASPVLGCAIARASAAIALGTPVQANASHQHQRPIAPCGSTQPATPEVGYFIL